MGLDSRDYMNDDADDGASSSGLLSSLSVTSQLLIINIAVFIAWQVWRHGAVLHDHFMVSAEGLLDRHRVWTLVTYAFSHLHPMHLLVNMLFLHWFGRDLERAIGGRRLALLYVLGAVGGALAQVALHLRDPALRSTPMVGASASVTALVITATLLTPQRRVLVWGILPAPLWALAVVFVGIDALGVARQVAQDGGAVEQRIGFAAHLGGAAVGVLFRALEHLRPAAPRRPGRPATQLPWSWLATAWRRRRLRVLPPLPADAPAPPRDDEDAGRAAPAVGLGRVDPETEARVDDLLRKINREGLQSLTAEEKAFLEQASTRYRK